MPLQLEVASSRPSTRTQTTARGPNCSLNRYATPPNITGTYAAPAKSALILLSSLYYLLPPTRPIADSTSGCVSQAEEHNGFLDALLDILQSEQDANLRLSSTCHLQDETFRINTLRYDLRWPPGRDSHLVDGFGPILYLRAYSCHLRQEPRQPSMGRHRSLSQRASYTRRREGESS